MTWINTNATFPHNVVSLDGLFNSHPKCRAPYGESNEHTDCMPIGGEFRFTFTKAGEFVYYCSLHAICTKVECSGMKGTVTVT